MMGKKNKKKNSSRSSSFSPNNEFSTFQDEIIEHLQLLKESNELIIGFNSVLRRIEKDTLCAVIYISRKGTAAMYHALNLMCKGKDLLFFNLQDINSIVFGSKIPSSPTYGIKKSIVKQPQFSRLAEKINTAINSRKNKKEKMLEKSLKNEDVMVESKDSQEDVQTENPCKNNKDDFIPRKREPDYIIHPKHSTLKQKCTGKEGMLNFQEVNFPNYKYAIFGEPIFPIFDSP